MSNAPRARRASDRERAIARALAQEVAAHGGITLTLDELLEAFEIKRFTDASRAWLDEALTSSGITAEPRMNRVQRGASITFSASQPRRRATSGNTERPWHTRKRVWALAALMFLALVGILGSSDSQPPGAIAEPPKPEATPMPTSTPDPAAELAAAIATADQNLGQDRYAAVLAALAVIDEPDVVERYERRIAWRLVRRARRALRLNANRRAIELAFNSRRYHRLPQSDGVISTADDRIAAARRARDQATCDASEMRTVRQNAGLPAGCTTFASELAASRAAAAAERAAREAAAAVPDEPNYSDDSSGEATGNWCGASRDGDGDGIWCEG